MLTISKIMKSRDQLYPEYKATVDLQGTGSWIKEYGKEIEIPSIDFFVFYHAKQNEWRVKVTDVWRIPNMEAGCVSKLNEPRQEEIEKLSELLAPYGNAKLSELPTQAKELRIKLNALLYDWTPCDHCKHAATCDKKFMVYDVYPKAHIFGSKSYNTWLLAMNVGAVVAKLVSPNYPKNTKQENIRGGCIQCAYVEFIKRDSDPDCIDAVTGTVTRDPDLYDSVERQSSTMDMRNSRDTREKFPYTRCKLSGKLVYNSDACSEYVWNLLLQRKTDWVPAASSAILKEKEAFGGAGDFQVVYQRRF